MNSIVGVRIAKFVALFGFFLPWAVFSCSGQEFATMSGVDVAIGHIHVNGQDQNAGLNLFIIVAIIATVLGLISSFGGEAKDEARGALIAAIIALLATFAGMMWLKGSPERAAREQAEQRNSNYNAQMNASVLAMIQIKEQPGYFITLLGLTGAAALSGMALNGQSLPQLPDSVTEQFLPARRKPEDDIADWDRLRDKDNPDELQEYLLRHPNGRFAELARMKLERMGVDPLPAPSPRQEPSAVSPEPASAAQHELENHQRPAVAAEMSHAFDAPPPFARSEDYAFDDAPTRKGPPIALIGAGLAVCVIGAAGFFWWQQTETERHSWEAVSHTDSAALRSYLSEHGAGPYANDARAALAQLEEQRFNAARASSDAYAMQAFLDEFPTSAHAQDARTLIGQVQAQNEFRSSAPSPLTPANGAILDGSGQQATFTWATLPGAVRYIVEIEVYDPATEQWVEDPASVLRAEASGESYNANLPSAQVERWRVQGIDQSGNASAFSDWAQFENKQ
ncbi:MAG: hypothetical protein HY054_08590 [Proteobacteria bacterium]|nr:hypothetical protein [Pseudomonadota bacterium]